MGGRPPVPADDPRVQTAKKMHADRNMRVADICATLRISRPTLYRHVALK
jgi:predicted DNA-binding transcriptional regulator AlpA